MSQGQQTFACIPDTVRGHFRLNFYGAVDCLLQHVGRMTRLAEKDSDSLWDTFPFLTGYAEQIQYYAPSDMDPADRFAWWDAELVEWESKSDRFLPLVALDEAQDKGFGARIAFLLVGMVEEDSRFGTVLHRLQQPLPYRRPCLETIGQMLKFSGEGEIDAWDLLRPLIAGGFLEVMDQSVPRAEWVLRVPALIWDAVRGDVDREPAQWCDYVKASACPALDELVLPPDFLEKLRQVPSLIRGDVSEAIVVRGSPGSDRRRIIEALAAAMDRNVVVVEASLKDFSSAREQLGPLCTVLGALPVLTYNLAPGETAEVPTLGGYQGPLGILLGSEGGLRGRVAERAVTLNVPGCEYSERRRHWQAAFRDRTVSDLDVICERFHLPGKYIRQAASMAIAHAALDQRETIVIQDVREACRSLNRQLLDTLADRLDVQGSWDWLIVSDLTSAKLEELTCRCRQRERLLRHLGPGFGAGTNRGVRALLTGASGTGKTMAAKILAAELGMDLYRVDLGAVVNKYIGETEKNLHRILTTAEDLDVLLLLDEGDSLLGSRTDVKSANDRYANLETNYLLQRLEHYQGVVVVTTNASENIDRAFQRRMDVVVNFVAPEAQQRLEIWQTHLPSRHIVDDEYLRGVATRCAMTGGQIRNAALHATLLAVDENAGEVARRHVQAAVRSEYRKGGGVCPISESLTGTGFSRDDELDSLLNMMKGCNTNHSGAASDRMHHGY